MGSFVDGYKALKDGMTKFNPKGISYRIRANGQKTYIGPQFWQELKKYTLPKLIQSFNCPILFIHGAKDETIPLAQMLALYKSVNQPKKKIILRGADHGLRPCRSQMNKIMVDWFSKKL